jgi:hypothetical protein
MFAKRSARAMALLLALPSAAFALGLGDIHLHSPLNAPLDADIELVDVAADEANTVQVQLASRDTFARYGLDWPTYLSSIKVTTARGSDGRQTIRLRSTDPITEPFVTLLVDVSWSRGHLVREYTMLLDPPVYAPGESAVASAPVAAPATGTGAREGSIARAAETPPAPSPAVTPAPAEGASAAAAPEGSSAAQSVNLLNGLIVANAINAVSNTTSSGAGLASSAAGSMFTDLAVAGTAIASNVAKNTTILLPGFGKVVLNEQIADHSAITAGLEVRMIHVSITSANVLGIAVGTQIIVASATSRVTIADGLALLRGSAYGTSGTGSLFSSSPVGLAALSCVGTNGATLTTNAVGISVPALASTGAITSTAKGSIAPALISAQTTSTIQTISLLSGLVTVSSLVVKSNVSSTDGVTATLNDTGTVFTNLTVVGHPEIVSAVPANTHVALTGIGTLYLRRQILQPHLIDEHGIELVILPGNTLGVPAQTIIVGRAAVGIFP